MQVSFDFANENVWEYLFISPFKAREFAALGSGNSEAKLGDGYATESVNNSVMRNQLNGNTANFANMEKYLDPPPTWVSPLFIERPLLLLRYPPVGKRTVYYLRAKVDYFAKNTHQQGMVMRITTYLDNSRVIVKEIHEWFENRRDKMYKRVRHFLNTHYFIEYFHPGSVGEVKQWLEYPGKRTDIQFHVRQDRLKRRIDVVGTKSVEYFEERLDKLKYRATYLTTDKSVTGTRQFALPGNGLSNEIYVLKMLQIYDRNSDTKDGTDVAKRTFFVKDGKAVVQYHFASGKITSNIKTFNHTRGGTSATANTSVPTASGTANLPPDTAPGTSGRGITSPAVAPSNHNHNQMVSHNNDDNPQDDDIIGMQEAAALERECFADVKKFRLLYQGIIDQRQDNEKNVTIDKTVFEASFENADKGNYSKSAGGADASGESKGVDYLSPYLRNVKDLSKMTKEEALEIRQTCLDALKARLVERANIIQSRLNEENSKLAKKQETFQRQQRDGDLSTEEYEKYCTAAMFRIQILEERLGKHEETALKKFADLDAKLAGDSRLKVLRNV